MRLIEQKNETIGVTVDNGALANYYVSYKQSGRLCGFRLTLDSDFKLHATKGVISVHGFRIEVTNDSEVITEETRSYQPQIARQELAVYAFIEYSAALRNVTLWGYEVKPNDEAVIDTAIEENISGRAYLKLGTFRKNDNSTFTSALNDITVPPKREEVKQLLLSATEQATSQAVNRLDLAVAAVEKTGVILPRSCYGKQDNTNVVFNNINWFRNRVGHCIDVYYDYANKPTWTSVYSGDNIPPLPVKFSANIISNGGSVVLEVIANNTRYLLAGYVPGYPRQNPAFVDTGIVFMNNKSGVDFSKSTGIFDGTQE